ncbi:acyl-CoA dehydrogenase family protein [Kitasatospora sp. NPDC088346]|uniref:acyl-CoA dehydrogenase family protein n=1 Tax=Kitasatospora sp. NPDC088346 TaxID=3364073 RepID=UPI003821C3C6
MHTAYDLALRFDRRMGDPDDGGRVFSYARSAELDAREEFPAEICRELDALGLPRHYVPAAHGGDLHSFEAALQLVRAVARRDLTVAIAHGKTFLGAVSVWVGGTAEQARALADRVIGGDPVSWGLTEREHGSDLLAGEVTARPADGGYLVTGEKWLINNATRGRLVCLLTRTGAGGPLGFSLLMIDKHGLDPSRYRPLPGVPLHGIRGADISGIAFTDAPVPASSVVGSEGRGMEIVLKSLQLTRTLCASLSLGAADNALSLALRSALGGVTPGGPAVDRAALGAPRVRHLLAQSYADLLLAEATTLVASRGIHSLTGEMSVASAVTKYFVPTLVDGLIAGLGPVLGAQSQLTGGDATAGGDRASGGDGHDGRYQKVLRDHQIVGIFDGNTLVNLHSLITQFPLLARQLAAGVVDGDGLAAATALHLTLPDFDRTRLSLLSRGGSSVVQGLGEAVRELGVLAAAGAVPASLAGRAEELRAEAERLAADLAAHRPTPVDVPAPAFALAERYARCYAGSAALHLWLRNRDSHTGRAALWHRGLWLEAVLVRILAGLRPGRPAPPDEVFERLLPVLLDQYESGDLPSLLNYPLVKDPA